MGHTTREKTNFRIIRSGLFRDLAEARRTVDSDPSAAVMNLCRIVISFKRGKIITSNLTAARWASKSFPEWSGLIRIARSQTNARHVREGGVPSSQVRKFLGFAMVRAVSFDAAWDIRLASKSHPTGKTRRVKR